MSTQCSNCGRSDLPLIPKVNMSTMEMTALCSVCLQNQGRKRKNLKSIEAELSELEDIAQKFESLIAIAKWKDDASDPILASPFALSPLRLYKGVQAQIADLKSQRMELIAQSDNDKHLKYELEKSVLNEDFEKAAKIRDKLDAIKKTKKNKKTTKKNKLDTDD